MFLLILVQIYKKKGENRMLNVIFIKKKRILLGGD